MGFVRVRRGERLSPPIKDGSRSLWHAVLDWARTREDIVAVVPLSAAPPGDPLAVQEILLLVRDRKAFAADERWHETALGSGIVIGREDIQLTTVSSRLLRLADGTCVQFWVAEAPSGLVTEMTIRSRPISA